MCYNGLLSRATDLLPARPLMPRRPAVLLIPPRHIPDSSLFCVFCTPVQKSEAHPLPLQSLPASLQKPRVCRHQRSSLATRPSFATSANSSLFLALLHQSEAHPLTFQSLTHSLCVYPGCRPDRFLRYLSTINCRLCSGGFWIGRHGGGLGRECIAKRGRSGDGMWRERQRGGGGRR